VIDSYRSRTGDGSGGTLEVKAPAAPALAAGEHGRRFSHIDLWFWLVAPSATNSLFNNTRNANTKVLRRYRSTLTKAMLGL
jgi:hypothetical protein